jgi:hypothetical protein
MMTAKSVTNMALRRKFGRAFTERRSYRRASFRLSSSRVRCRVSWLYLSDRYRGAVTVWKTTSDTYRYSARVRRL